MISLITDKQSQGLLLQESLTIPMGALTVGAIITFLRYKYR
uniref:Uncharacterized protein n=1 Tax=Lepeophtheirus salmonis TaxID=72036 RepID=A0A0K2TCH8_LEPSM